MKLGRTIAKGATIGALLTVIGSAALAAEPGSNADVRSPAALKAPPAIPALHAECDGTAPGGLRDHRQRLGGILQQPDQRRLRPDREVRWRIGGRRRLFELLAELRTDQRRIPF